MTTTDVQLLDAQQAAGILGVSLRTLWTLTKSQGLATVRFGRSVRYRLEDINAWIASRVKVSHETAPDTPAEME